MLDVEQARSRFPALASGYIFGDNAGGSQITKDAVDRISHYLLNTNVQLGMNYSVSAEGARRVGLQAPIEAVQMFNARSIDEIVFGASSTHNLESLTRGLESNIQPGDEFIVTGEHEANAGPWKKLAARKGAVVKYWHPRPTVEGNPYSVKLDAADLVDLITSRTRIVTFTACSNILGSVVPVKEVAKIIRETAQARGSPKVEISVDCVAYAPHRRIDVQDWDVDFAVFSYYKVYGPHISSLYVRSDALENSVSSVVHHFLDVHKVSYKLQPGGPGYENVWGSTGVLPYLLSLSQEHTLKASYDAIAQHEQVILKPLMDFLTAPAQRERGVRVVGEETISLNRVPTVCFVVVGDKPMRSRDIVAYFDKQGGIGIRFGHFYAYTLLDRLEPKIDMADGVVRISLVHYNTLEEVQTIIRLLKEVLA